MPVLCGGRTGGIVFQPDRTLPLPAAVGAWDRMPGMRDDPGCGLPAPAGFCRRLADAPPRLCSSRIPPVRRLDVGYRPREPFAQKMAAPSVCSPVCALVGVAHPAVFAGAAARFIRTTGAASTRPAPVDRPLNRFCFKDSAVPASYTANTPCRTALCTIFLRNG